MNILPSFLKRSLLFLGILTLPAMGETPLQVDRLVATQPLLTLESFLWQVKEKNLAYLAQQQRIPIARAEVVAQRIFPNPTLLFDAYHGSYIIDLEYQLELGKRRGRLAVAKSQATLEELAVAYFLQELRAEAAQAYGEALYRKALFEIAQNSYHSMHRLYQSDSIRAAVGEISQVDARRSKVEATTLWGETVMEEAHYQAALVQLQRYMGGAMEGLSGAVMASLLDVLPLPKEYSLAELCLLGQTQRQEILLAMQQLGVADKELQLAKVNRRPDVGVHVGYERDWNGWMPSRSTLFAGVSVPLTFSALNKGAVQAAKYRQQQVEREAADVQNLVESEVTQAYLFWQAAQARVAQYQTGLLREADEVVAGVRLSYQKGDSNLLDLLCAQRDYNEVQKGYAEAVKELFAALIELQRSCGVGYDV